MDEQRSQSSDGNLRQYYRPEPVQAAQIIETPEPHSDCVRIADQNGMINHIGHRGLFTAPDGTTRTPQKGDWVLLWAAGKTTWATNEEFHRDWAPVKGPTLS